MKIVGSHGIPLVKMDFHQISWAFQKKHQAQLKFTTSSMEFPGSRN